MIRTTDYPRTPTQEVTAARHAHRRGYKERTAADVQRIEAAAAKRLRKGRAAD